jgi:hypothetical protein
MSRHTHTYIHNTYIHTYIYTYIHNTYIHTYIYTYINAYIYTYVNTYIYTHTHVHIHTYIRTYIRTYLCTYIHIYTYIHIIYLLTAIGLSAGGRSKVHIYTQTVQRTIQNKQYIEQHNNFGRVRAVPRLG